MPYQAGQPTPILRRQATRTLLKTHRKTWIVIKRSREKFNDIGEPTVVFDTVYEGDSLVRPGSGTVQSYGLGTVENLSLIILLAGVHNIRQGDVVTVNDGREYEIQYPPTWLDAFQVLTLQQRSQLGQSVTP